MENFAMALTIFGALSLSVCLMGVVNKLDGGRNV
jgi:hypothetical protein